MNKLIITIALLTILSGFNVKAQQAQKKPYVVVLSMDGFRWDYTQKVKTPNFDRIAKQGTKAESLQPSFPSKTFPNHYTIATGLYPGHHGLVNNTFYDTEKKVTYKISNRTAVGDKDFYGGEPVWNTAEKQGMKAASFFWVGSEAPVQDIRPSIWKKYDHHFPWEARVDSIINWLSLPTTDRPHLLMWYIHEPDSKGHKYGPNSKQVKKQIKKLDTLLGYFLDALDTLPHKDEINIIITTDHGMGEVKTSRFIALENYIEDSDLEYFLTGNPVMFIQPKPQQLQTVYNKLKSVEHISVTKKGERPAHWHYNDNKRIADLVVVADSAWSVGWKIPQKKEKGGTHGYDPKNKDMHGIFYAKGPAFKKDYIHPCFENVDIYNLITHILGLTPAPNDGNFDRVKGMLK